MRRRTTSAAVALAATLWLVGCSGDGDSPLPSAAPSTTTSAAEPVPTPTTAAAAPAPRNLACYSYGYAAAVAPVARGKSVPCDSAHNAITFSVGDLDTVVDGHLVSVDSDRVQAQIAAECPRAFARFVGGSVQARRLSMLRTVWFTPSLRESDAGANWYRCDAVAIAADERLAPLVGRLRGVLDRPKAAERYAMCGTAEPGTPGFRRVICSTKHAWVALSTVDIAGRAYPGVAKVRAAGQQTCQDAASAQADDPLNYEWGYEWPTQTQWQTGQHYGICWGVSSG
ncbi:septum formation family protein [Nocardioides agariphilus]|jgi:hypothetical protein|uniref:Septum formation family protein n=2 Tax=Nocardioides agariphilus TaxID=433664 RepID=A0A930VNS9_9ACTN|nr:septum formation family protein [Nocardioides agariphilus]